MIIAGPSRQAKYSLSEHSGSSFSGVRRSARVVLAPVPRVGNDPPLIPAALPSDMVVEVDDALMLRGFRRTPCAVDEEADGGPI